MFPTDEDILRGVAFIVRLHQLRDAVLVVTIAGRVDRKAQVRSQWLDRQQRAVTMSILKKESIR
jgi:hypothetical protein